MVAPLGLEVEDCVLARLYTFGKASAASDASGGACLSSVSLQSSRFTIIADAYQAHYQ
jgi:hypothetical protein